MSNAPSNLIEFYLDIRYFPNIFFIRLTITCYLYDITQYSDTKSFHFSSFIWTNTKIFDNISIE